MKYKGTLIVVKDCNCALKFYSDMFGFQLLQNIELGNAMENMQAGMALRDRFMADNAM